MTVNWNRESEDSDKLVLRCCSTLLYHVTVLRYFTTLLYRITVPRYCTTYPTTLLHYVTVVRYYTTLLYHVTVLRYCTTLLYYVTVPRYFTITVPRYCTTRKQFKFVTFSYVCLHFLPCHFFIKFMPLRRLILRWGWSAPIFWGVLLSESDIFSTIFMVGPVAFMLALGIVDLVSVF